MNLTRREALRGTTATVAAIAAGGAVTSAVARDPLRDGVQELVRMIREELPSKIMAGTSDALQQAADYLETLSGIEPVRRESWERWQRLTRNNWEDHFPLAPRLPFSVKRYPWEAAP